MTTIAVGTTVTVTLDSNASVAVATSGGFWQSVVTPAIGTASTSKHGPLTQHRVFGPYPGGASVALTNMSSPSMVYVPSNVGGASAAQQAAAAASNQAPATPIVITNPNGTQSLVDPSGNVIALGDALNAGTPLIIAATGTKVTRNSVSSSADTAYQALYTATLPGSVMGPNGFLSGIFSVNTTSSATVKSLCLMVDGVIVSQEYTVTTVGSFQRLVFCLWNQGSETANAYVPGGAPNGNASALAPITTAIDTTAPHVVTLAVKWTSAVAGESISLNHGHLLIEPGF